MIKILYIFIIGVLTSYSTHGQSVEDKSHFEFSLDTLKLYDQSRQREIPIAIYQPTSKVSCKQKIIIFSHGYGQNKGGDYLAYSYLT
jgi:predicted peptidase